MISKFLKKIIHSVSILLFLLLCFSSEAMAVSLTKEQLFFMATAAAKEGSYQSSADLFRKVLDVDPHFAPAYNSLGLVYQSWDGGNLDEAIRYFRLAIDMNPDYIEARNNLGRAYYTRGNFSQAKEIFLQSLEVKEDQADIHLALAWACLLGESDADPAIDHFHKALALMDDDMAHYGLGLSYLLVGTKFKVLEEITELRRRHKDAEASSLEKMVRENAKISSTKGKPLVTGRDLGGSVFDKELAAVTSAADKGDKDKKGIQVRLTGPLW
ncbi:MAG: tetratricopeptide repeat protein [Candidatus Omnitrophica bacterium]|nr:tetratricopeptide repeat protein [Candidatus Omnitrophota bacterium]